MKPSVLIIPELFPTDLAPGNGIFMNDQMKALTGFADVCVFNTNPWYRGIYEQSHHARYYDFHLFSRKWAAPLNLLAYAWWERKSIALALKTPRPDVIHLHGAALRGGIAAALAKHWQVPLVIAEHTGPWSAIASRKMLFRQAKKAMETACMVLPVSEHLKNEILHSGINPKRIKVTGNPVDTEFFGLRAGDLVSPRNILFAGRLDEFKGGLRTLKAFHSLVERLPGWKLTIAGDGAEADAILNYIYANNLQERVDFHRDFFSRMLLRDFFHGASMLVFPSMFESFGLVGAEALATGLPVVITNRTGPRDYFSAECGVCVDPGSIDEIAEGMMQVSRSIHEYRPANLRSRIVDHFGIKQYAGTLAGVYESLRREGFS